MTAMSSCLFVGRVVHRRYRPVRHELNYKVVNLFADVDQLSAISRKSRLFGYNVRRLFSVQDKNHGRGDGAAIAGHVRELMGSLDQPPDVARVFMFCYPAVLGRVFNPLTVYFGFDRQDQLCAVVYEVNNNFGERHSYVVRADGGGSHRSDKKFYVSPYNPDQGEYRFGVEMDGNRIRLNIALFEDGLMKLCARFDGFRRPLNDTNLLRSAASLSVQPLKIVAGIHWEALRLFVKGLRPVPRPAHPKFAATVAGTKP